MVIKRPQMTTVEEKTLILSLSYLEDIYLETRAKLRKSLKGILNWWKPQIVFKSLKKLAKVFQIKYRLPFDIMPEVVHKYTCGRCKSFSYGETYRHLKIRSGEHIGILTLPFRKAEPSKENGICEHLLICSNTSSFEQFTILAYSYHKYVLEFKKSLLIKRDKLI